MAYIRKPHLLFLFFCLIFAAHVLQGTVEASRKHGMLPYQQREGNLQESNKNSRSSMIGSVKPTCTYNECRGCRYKCRAEQVPVEGNDPINSAYHYKCVCHSCC